MSRWVLVTALTLAACGKSPVPPPPDSSFPQEVKPEDLVSLYRSEQYYNVPIAVEKNMRIRSLKQSILGQFSLDYIVDSNKDSVIQCDLFEDLVPTSHSVINGSGEDEWRASKYSSVHHGSISITVVGSVKSGRCWTRPGSRFSF